MVLVEGLHRDTGSGPLADERFSVDERDGDASICLVAVPVAGYRRKLVFGRLPYLMGGHARDLAGGVCLAGNGQAGRVEGELEDGGAHCERVFAQRNHRASAEPKRAVLEGESAGLAGAFVSPEADEFLEMFFGNIGGLCGRRGGGRVWAEDLVGDLCSESAGTRRRAVAHYGDGDLLIGIAGQECLISGRSPAVGDVTHSAIGVDIQAESVVYLAAIGEDALRFEFGNEGCA